jgi:hypothetical protein
MLFASWCRSDCSLTTRVLMTIQQYFVGGGLAGALKHALVACSGVQTLATWLAQAFQDLPGA